MATASPDHTVAVEVADGQMDLHIWLPLAGHGPGVLLISEIFGVGEFIEAKARDLAREGFVVGAPDLFCRVSPGWAADHDAAGMQASMELAGQLDVDQAVADCAAAIVVLRQHDAVGGDTLTVGDGPVGLLGYCLGGTLAWLVAAETDPDCAVAYYGSGIPERAAAVAGITCPTLVWFGSDDPFIPVEGVEAVRGAVMEGGHANVEVRVEAAGHAWENHLADVFYSDVATAASWPATVAFLAEHLGLGVDA